MVAVCIKEFPIEADMGSRQVLKTKEGGRDVELVESEDRDYEIYCDGIQGMMSSGETVKINFFTRGFPNQGEDSIERREMAVRLVLPLRVFFSVAEFFEKQSGIIKKDLKINGSGEPKKVEK